MPARLLALGAAVLLAACQMPGGGGRTPTAPASPPVLPSAAPAPRPPAELALDAAAVGRVMTAADDHLTAEHAAEQEVNQPLALTAYWRWGWVEASRRTFGPVTVTLLLCSSPAGAAQAFAAWRPPGTADSTASGPRTLSVQGDRAAGRAGPYAYQIQGPDAGRLAAQQQSRLPA